MFVLYYQESDHDYHQMEMLFCSPSREKLEQKKSELSGPSQKFREEMDEYNRLKERDRKNYWNSIANWLEENKNAILPWAKFDTYPDASRQYYGFSWPSMEYRRCTSDISKFAPETIEKDRKLFIENIRVGREPYPWKLADFIDDKKVKSPMPTPKKSTLNEPEFEGKLYLAGNLYIEEVQEI